MTMLRSLFATRLYEAEISDAGLLADLAHSIRSLAADDMAGQRWSREHGYKGYTSYASLNDLPKRDPAFADLARALTRHAARLRQDCAFNLDRKPRLDSLWVNLLKAVGIIVGTFIRTAHLRTMYCRSASGKRRDPRRGPATDPNDGGPYPPRGRAGGFADIRHRRSPSRPDPLMGKLAAP